MVILGIDPGYDRLGLSLIDKPDKGKEKLIFSDCIQTSSKNTIYERLAQIGKRISQIFDEYKPDSLAIENLFITKNQKTAMRVSEVRGIIIYEAVKRNVPVAEFSPMEIKTAITGDGTSDKTRMIKMINLLVNTNGKKMLDDEYDAIAVALTYCANTKLNSKI